MLSDDLKALRGRFREFSDSGCALDPEDVRAVCAVLDTAVRDAHQLEIRPVPVIDQVADLPANVVRLATALHSGGVRVGMPPEGGAA